MIFPAIHDASPLPVRGLYGKCLFDDKTVLQLVPKEVSETFSFIYLSGTEQKVKKRIL
jgi:hypothetical protein